MERGRVNDVDDISEEEGDNQLFDNQLLRNERSAFEDDEVQIAFNQRLGASNQLANIPLTRAQTEAQEAARYKHSKQDILEALQEIRKREAEQVGETEELIANQSIPTYQNLLYDQDFLARERRDKKLAEIEKNLANVNLNDAQKTQLLQQAQKVHDDFKDEMSQLYPQEKALMNGGIVEAITLYIHQNAVHSSLLSTDIQQIRNMVNEAVKNLNSEEVPTYAQVLGLIRSQQEVQAEYDDMFQAIEQNAQIQGSLPSVGQNLNFYINAIGLSNQNVEELLAQYIDVYIKTIREPYSIQHVRDLTKIKLDIIDNLGVPNLHQQQQNILQRANDVRPIQVPDYSKAMLLRQQGMLDLANSVQIIANSPSPDFTGFDTASDAEKVAMINRNQKLYRDIDNQYHLMNVNVNLMKYDDRGGRLDYDSIKKQLETRFKIVQLLDQNLQSFQYLDTTRLEEVYTEVSRIDKQIVPQQKMSLFMKTLGVLLFAGVVNYERQYITYPVQYGYETINSYVEGREFNYELLTGNYDSPLDDIIYKFSDIYRQVGSELGIDEHHIQSSLFTMSKSAEEIFAKESIGESVMSEDNVKARQTISNKQIEANIRAGRIVSGQSNSTITITGVKPSKVLPPQKWLMNYYNMQNPELSVNKLLNTFKNEQRNIDAIKSGGALERDFQVVFNEPENSVQLVDYVEYIVGVVLDNQELYGNGLFEQVEKLISSLEITDFSLLSGSDFVKSEQNFRQSIVRALRENTQQINDALGLEMGMLNIVRKLDLAAQDINKNKELVKQGKMFQNFLQVQVNKYERELNNIGADFGALVQHYNKQDRNTFTKASIEIHSLSKKFSKAENGPYFTYYIPAMTYSYTSADELLKQMAKVSSEIVKGVVMHQDAEYTQEAIDKLNKELGSQHFQTLYQWSLEPQETVGLLNKWLWHTTYSLAHKIDADHAQQIWTMFTDLKNYPKILTQTIAQNIHTEKGTKSELIENVVLSLPSIIRNQNILNEELQSSKYNDDLMVEYLESSGVNQYVRDLYSELYDNNAIETELEDIAQKITDDQHMVSSLKLNQKRMSSFNISKRSLTNILLSLYMLSEAFSAILTYYLNRKLKAQKLLIEKLLEQATTSYDVYMTTKKRKQIKIPINFEVDKSVRLQSFVQIATAGYNAVMSYNTLVGMLVPQLARMNNTIETIDMMQYSIMGITNYSITGFVVGVAPSLVIFAGRIIFDYVTKGFANQLTDSLFNQQQQEGRLMDPNEGTQRERQVARRHNRVRMKQVLMPYKVGAEVATKIAKVTYKGITDEIKRPKMGDVQKYVVSKAAKELERNNKMRTNALYVSSLKSNNNYRKIIQKTLTSIDSERHIQKNIQSMGLQDFKEPAIRSRWFKYHNTRLNKKLPQLADTKPKPTLIQEKQLIVKEQQPQKQAKSAKQKFQDYSVDFSNLQPNTNINKSLLNYAKILGSNIDVGLMMQARDLNLSIEQTYKFHKSLNQLHIRMQIDAMKRTQHNRPIDAGDLQTRASKLIKLNDKVYLMSGYKNIDKYQVQRMRVAYMEESIPIMQKAALTRLRYGESSKIKKRDLKLIEKELNLSKAQSSIYDYRPPEDIQSLIRASYEELVSQDIEPEPSLASLKDMLESNDKYFQL